MSAHLILLVAGAALFNPLPNDDGDLVQVSGSGEPAIWYVDKKSVVRSGRDAEARIVVRHMKGRKVRHVQDLEVYVDCRSRRVLPVSVADYAPGGALLAQRAISGTDDRGLLTQPRTPAAGAVSYICGDIGRWTYSLDSSLRVQR
jgi:hypothetical protein